MAHFPFNMVPRLGPVRESNSAMTRLIGGGGTTQGKGRRGGETAAARCRSGRCSLAMQSGDPLRQRAGRQRLCRRRGQTAGGEMAVGRGRTGIAPGSAQTCGGVCHRARHIGQPRGRVPVVPPGGAGLARHTSAPSAIGVRAHRLPFAPSANRSGETLCARLDAEAADASRSLTFPRTIRRRRRAMKGWFVPPIVIPIVIVVSLVGLASFRAFF